MTWKFDYAFAFVQYTTEDGSDGEVLWNSRDGGIPSVVLSCESGAEMKPLARQGGPRPEHVPEVGDRIIVDLTLQRARVVAATMVEQATAMMSGLFPSREVAVERMAESLLQKQRPDVLVVTAGFIEELLESRGRGAEPVTQVSPDSSPSYWGRNGDPIPFEVWAASFEDPAYRQVDYTEVAPAFYVSTVWLGDKKDRLFETAICDSRRVLTLKRHSSNQSEAARIHLAGVLFVSQPEAQQQLVDSAVRTIDPVEDDDDEEAN